jgi:hypothetical protein
VCRYIDLTIVTAQERRVNVLRHVFEAWRTAIGHRAHDAFVDTVRLNNIGAQMNGYEDAGALWRSPYEMAAPTLARGPTFHMEQVGSDGLSCAVTRLGHRQSNGY